jgi:hypothetical protein
MLSVMIFRVSGPESVFGFTGIGTSLAGGGTTWARAANAGAYKSAPATRPRRVEVRNVPVMPVSELSRE